MRKIGTEEHLCLESWQLISEVITDEKIIPLGVNRKAAERQNMLLADVEDYRLKDMDDNDVAVQMLASGPSVHYIRDSSEAIHQAAEMNDYIAGIVKRHPTRFAGMAQLPLQNPQAAVRELERAVRQLGFKGVMVYGHVRGRYLDEKDFWPVWECAEALEVPIYIHPTHAMPDQIRNLDGHPELIGPTWNWNTETGTHALRVLFSGIFDTFPKTTMIIGHLGEFIPAALWRLENHWNKVQRGDSTLPKPEHINIRLTPREYLAKNVMITTSGNFSTNLLEFTIKEIGADRILFAVDYPHESSRIASEFIERANISETDRRKICYENAEKLFKLN